MNRNIIRITKEINFEMAHALYGYEGPCKNIHGHSYHLSVCIRGEVKHNPAASDNGMVIDFSVLKEIIKTNIINQFDHALLLNAQSPHKELARGIEPFEKVILTDYQPTCENILIDIVKKIRHLLPSNTTLHHLTLRETPNSFAEWFSEDNSD
ncbi:MAG: 6-carboxytetrahydropterin synthase [Flavobacteriales bacterium]|nr:6-carboxytetrahydropterin synthase [Flavobacteriales bacterium]